MRKRGKEEKGARLDTLKEREKKSERVREKDVVRK